MKKNNNFPELLKENNNITLLEKYNNLKQSEDKKVRNLHSKLSSITIEDDMARQFVGDISNDTVNSGKTALVLSNVLEVEPQKVLQKALYYLDQNQNITKEQLKMKLLEYIVDLNVWISDIAKEMLLEKRDNNA